MKKINRTANVDIRITPEEKEFLKNYCKQKGVSISDFTRTAWDNLIEQEKRAKNE